MSSECTKRWENLERGHKTAKTLTALIHCFHKLTLSISCVPGTGDPMVTVVYRSLTRGPCLSFMGAINSLKLHTKFHVGGCIQVMAEID
jgi:hypothetical protein